MRIICLLCILAFAVGCGGNEGVSAPEKTVTRPDDLKIGGTGSGGGATGSENSGAEAAKLMD